MWNFDPAQHFSSPYVLKSLKLFWLLCWAVSTKGKRDRKWGTGSKLDKSSGLWTSSELAKEARGTKQRTWGKCNWCDRWDLISLIKLGVYKSVCVREAKSENWYPLKAQKVLKKRPLQYKGMKWWSGRPQNWGCISTLLELWSHCACAHVLKYWINEFN